MKAAMVGSSAQHDLGSPWALHMQAIALDEPGRLALSLSGAIIQSGGWVLSRSVTDTGIVAILFEFERHTCIDVYSGLVGAGLELTRSGHMRFTELCQCTHNNRDPYRAEIVSIDLEIQTYPFESSAREQGIQAT
jgi:hypothetical protein